MTVNTRVKQEILFFQGLYLRVWQTFSYFCRKYFWLICNWQFELIKNRFSRDDIKADLKIWLIHACKDRADFAQGIADKFCKFVAD
jgi:hypothetical protein